LIMTYWIDKFMM
jgi:hypothetical protein